MCESHFCLTEEFTVHVLLEIAGVHELCPNASFFNRLGLALSEEQVPRFVVNASS